MTSVPANKVLGEPVDRIDGRLKVTGAAPYPSDVGYPDMAHAVLVQSTIAAGSIRAIDTAEALAAPGILTVITHENVPPLADAPMTPLGPSPRFPLKDDRIVHHGQHVAVVVAQTPEQARAAARLVRVDYEQTAAVLGIGNPEATVTTNPFGMDAERGDVAGALASADVVYDETFRMAPETNNPIGLFATVARWDGGRLLVHDSSQWPVLARRSLAAVFSLPEADVRVLVPYLGGGFGAGLRTWPHVILTALAARVLERPVKLVLTRAQMFTSIGHRPESVQRVRIGATREGRLVAIDHEGTSTCGAEETNLEPITMATPAGYACPNVATRDRLVHLNIPNPGPMRGPGHVQGNFAIESAMDELSYHLGIDPLELRLRNHADVHPPTGLPWSSNALRECYRMGAERIGWNSRNPRPRSLREGEWLIGYGVAGVTFGWYATPCQARLSIGQDGTARVRSASTDIGTGTYTITAQLAAELLGLDVDRVHVELGDSDLPPAPQSGGSGLAVSLTGAIEDGAAKLVQAFSALVRGDDRSPLHGRQSSEITATNGRIHLAGDPTVGETYAGILARHDLDELAVVGEKTPNPQADGTTMVPAGAFAAQFAEVRVHEDLGILRVARLVSAVDAGRLLNEKTARSQVAGAVVMGIGMAHLEETTFDADNGRITNATFGDYLIPVNADVPDLDVVFVGEPDRFNPLGIKGVGEVGLVGVPAAIANAVYHATGKRVRDLPITIEKLIA
ncbi:xanthine dehydrogenase family protein molybdopterin-binding subunit [Saccharopolyspora sp. K220]|uniref:xanthine dehydrogenase family protein molybdopterin-binding subunit n=1 Tax=Saccharopolyspora soli TaxID=2926618 RepID=UPI001F55C238|nr:xanthine dehydrogenase family protein molybdopterin-binding subunit [Saccharopolyspora soli]MCI2419817.1 xanthine dehydrogenase family protein molybdopterin-binding subunit [Saccharopolyspora soli]